MLCLAAVRKATPRIDKLDLKHDRVKEKNSYSFSHLVQKYDILLYALFDCSQEINAVYYSSDRLVFKRDGVDEENIVLVFHILIK